MKLGSHYGGVLFPSDEGSAGVETLVILLDGTDLAEVVEVARQVPSSDQYVVSFGVDAELVAQQFGGSRFVSLGDVDGLHGFKRVTALLDGDEDSG